MGTPEFATHSLRACFDVGEVVAVVTQPDKPKGRGQELAPPPVKVLAQERGVEVLQPPKLKQQNFGEVLRRYRPDVTVVTAYGKILPRDVLQAARRGAVNVHASLLPRWRGAAPIQWAIAEGDEKTGVCLMQMDEGLDAGAVISCAEIPIAPTDTSATLHDKLAVLGGDLLRRDLRRYVDGELVATPQPAEGVTLARIIQKEDGRIDFTRPAEVIERRLRAFTPWPGAFTWLKEPDGRRILFKVHRAAAFPDRPEGAAPGAILPSAPGTLEVACGTGRLALLEVQPEGRRRMTAAEFLSGRRLEPGTAPFADAPSDGGPTP
ncbi:MAG: methionyl-tRNA formyltransferase [Myxococcaceae bacterium]|nr:methionyl-tRNA formyltransferase [Myxococcaceae bacterium]